MIIVHVVQKRKKKKY